MPEHTKVMGKEWADARRQASIDQLRTTVAPLLVGQATFTFELGCGHGHWLAAYAAKHPEEFCLGIDLITLRVEKSLRKQSLGKIANIAFLKAEATEFLEALPAGCTLGKIFILYPDPWPKKKHHKHRFISPENLSLLAQHALPGTRLHFRTDHADYHAWTLEHLATDPHWKIIADEAWPFEQMTFFEERTKLKRDIIAVRVA